MQKFTRHLFSKLFLLSSIVASGSGAASSPPLTTTSPISVHSPPLLTPHNGKAALVMIEFVNEWLAPQGKLRSLIEDEEQLSRSQIAAQQALAAARKAGIPVIHTTLKLSPDYREFGSLRFGLRGAIAKAGTWQKQDKGWQFYPPFAPQAHEFVVSGRAGASAFAASDLDNYLRGQGITRLYLAGYATHVCIESTLRAAHDLGYEAVVLSDATAAFTAQQQQHVLNEVIHHFGWAIPTQEFVKALSTSDGVANASTKESTTALPAPTAAGTLHTLTAPGQEIPGISGTAIVNDGLLLLSGHVPVAADGSVAPTLEGQLEQVFQNMSATLLHAGSSPQHIARMTLYVRGYQPEQLDTIRSIRDRWLKGHAPASALIGVEALFRPDIQVEVDAIAVLR